MSDETSGVRKAAAGFLDQITEEVRALQFIPDQHQRWLHMLFRPGGVESLRFIVNDTEDGAESILLLCKHSYMLAEIRIREEKLNGGIMK